MINNNTCIPSSNCENPLHLDTINKLCLTCTTPNDYYDSNSCIPPSSCTNPLHLDTINKITLSQQMPEQVFKTIKNLLKRTFNDPEKRISRSTIYENKIWINSFKK